MALLRAVKKNPWLIAAGAILLFHALTLRSTWIDDDEAIYSNYVFTGHWGLWSKLFPFSLRFPLNATYAFEVAPYQMAFHRLAFHFFGMGVWQIRLAGMIGCALSLLLFGLYLRKSAPPLMTTLIIVATGLSQIYFFTSHIGRSEPLNGAIILLNLWWLFHDHGAATGFLSGFAAISGFGFHPNIITFLAPFPVAVWLHEDWKAKRWIRYLWWIAGAILGGIVFMKLVDVDAAVWGARFQRGFCYQPPAIINFRGNIPEVFLSALHLVKAFPHRQFSWLPALVLSVLALSTCYLRRWKSEEGLRRELPLMSLLLFVGYAFLTGSGTVNYQVFIFPWLYAAGILAVYDLWTGRLALNRNDILIILGFLLFLLLTDVSLPILLGCIPLLLRAAPVAFERKNLRRSAILLTFFLLVVSVGGFYGEVLDDTVYTWRYFSHQALYSPFHTAVTFLWPWVVFHRTESWFAIRQLGWKNQDRTIAIGLAALLTLNFAAGIRWEIHQMARRQSSQDLPAALHLLDETPRVIGPAELWLYRPSDHLQASQMLSWSRIIWRDCKSYNMDLALRYYRPQIILWPKSEKEDFEKAASRFRGVRVHKGREWALPFGVFCEFRPDYDVNDKLPTRKP